MTAQSSSSNADYRRRARRIRASFSGNSFLTQQAIQTLAKSRDLEMQRDEPAPVEVRRYRTSRFQNAQAVITAPAFSLPSEISPVVERGFARHAITKLQAFGFTYSDRIALLNSAEQLGVSRFRANLILAMQENQSALRHTAPRAESQSVSLPGFLWVMVIEIAIVLALVWLIAH